MNITFWGASGEVTGSCYLIETQHARVMVDCGIHQGYPEAEALNHEMPWDRSMRLDAVVLTHAHLDHSGRLPLLNSLPGTWKIHTTPASAALTDILLQDSARLQEHDAETETRRRRRAGRPPSVPLFTVHDAAETISRIRTAPYDQHVEIAPGITIRFVDAGHILGSASVEMRVEEHGVSKTIAFSGDIGVPGTALLRDPMPLTHADVLLLESTYGDRDHRPLSKTLDELTEIILEAQRQQEKVLIPAFAVARSQNLIYHLASLHRAGRIPHLPVFLDSPMAIAATELYRSHTGILDAETQALMNARQEFLTFPGLKYSSSAEDSKRLNDLRGAAIIIAGSGMCTGGRIVHHLRHNLWRKGVNVVFVGYQGQGTLGRRLVDRPRFVRIFGEEIAVSAEIHTLGGLSAHAGQSTLVDWSAPLFAGSAKPKVFLTHGEDGPRTVLAGKLQQRFGVTAQLPMRGDRFEL